MIKQLDKQSRLDLFRKASPEVQDLYGNEENGRVVVEAARSINITDDDSYDTLALTVGDIILGSYKKESLGQLLEDRMELSDTQIVTIEKILHDFLLKVPEHKDAATFTIVPPVEAKVAQPLVKPLRTFAEDIGLSRAHGYGAFRSGESVPKVNDEEVHRSSQDDIIKQ